MSVFLFLQKNYCTLKLQPNSRSTKKKLRIADWTNYLRYTLTQRGGIANGRALALHARDTDINTSLLQKLRPCAIVIRFLKKNYCILKLNAKSRTTKKKLKIDDWAKHLSSTLQQGGGSPNVTALALHGRGMEVNAPHLQNLRYCVIVIRFQKKNYCIWKLHSKVDLLRKTS